MTHIIKTRIQSLRTDMQKNKVDGVIIPSGDPHQSEYIADHWAVREWISGFTGSAGTLIVLADYAALWTDPRYFIQADIELAGSGITLHKQTVPHAPEHLPWLVKQLSPGKQVGLDARLFSVHQLDHISALFSTHHLTLITQYNPFDNLWVNRPVLPASMIFEHDIHFSFISREIKMGLLKAKILSLDADYLVLSTLDDIAWILNLRGDDIPFNPLFYAYLLLGKESCLLFINENKISSILKESLSKENITISPYENIMESIAQLGHDVTFVVHPESLNAAIYEIIPPERCLTSPNWIMELKAVKSKNEITHIQRAMLKDGVALIRAFRWLESGIEKGKIVSEFDFAEKCAFYRSQQVDYKGESFNAIVGYNSNGAIIHYHPHSEKSAIIKKDGLLLVDSGGQYLDGTTDITRTIFIGKKPPIKVKKHFTLVLKGFISLASAQFPPGTVGMQLDTLARIPLWKEGLNYAHGTGHGVGFFLSVHEGPQGFATNPTTSRGTTPLKPGMITTNEPGVYLEGKYGIRIENILLCKELENGFLAFEDLTLFPVSQQLIDSSLLNQDEKEWLNNYHRLVWNGLSPFISEDEKEWLQHQCAPI